MTVAPSLASDQIRDLATRPIAARIRGIDVARAVAIVGMVMVHIGPARSEGFGLTGAVYRAPLGHASILFVLVAGIGVSLLAGDRSRPRLRGTTARLLWRAAVLLPLGVALQTLDTPVAVIIQYYAVYFLVAVVAVRLTGDLLLWLAAAAAMIGPAILVGVSEARPGWFNAGLPAWDDFDRLARDLVVSGYYPALIWTAPLLIGIWLGRQDLRSSRVAGRCVALGGLIGGGALLLGNELEKAVGDVESRSAWIQLFTNEPHRGMPLWVISATAIAVAMVGIALVVARRAARATWPLAAMGQLALTVYIGHLLVLATWPEWLVRTDFDDAWIAVGRFVAVSLTVAVIWRALAPRGPVEALLHLPWWRTRPLGSFEASDALEGLAGPADRDLELEGRALRE